MFISDHKTLRWQYMYMYNVIYVIYMSKNAIFIYVLTDLRICAMVSLFISVEKTQACFTGVSAHYSGTTQKKAVEEWKTLLGDKYKRHQ